MICESCKFENSPENLTCERCKKNLFKGKLLLTLENEPQQTLYLFPNKYTIGRGKDNHIVLENDSVSRHHAEICFVNNHFQIQDKDSKNGSLLNNNHFKQRILHDNDCIQIGNVILHFYSEEKNDQSSEKGLNTEEWVQNEFFKFAQNKETKITTDDVLLTMLDLAISLIHADQAVILQFDPSNKLRFKVGKEQQGQQLFENKLSDFDWTIINDGIRKKSMNYVIDDSHSENQNKISLEHSIWRKIAIPLVATKIRGLQIDSFGINGILGVVYFTQNKNTRSISGRKIELLNTIVQQITFAVQNDMLYDQALEKRKFEKDLFLAREIQQRLNPASHPEINNFEIANYIHPCDTVSGDYCDFIPISSQAIGIAIGDICGKGVPAALLTHTVQAAIHSQLDFTVSPEQIIRNLNRLLIKSTAESIFLTLFFGILEIETGDFRYINAGHPPPIFVSKDLTIKELRSTSPPLGILEDKFNSEKLLKFNSGDLLLMYTDGLIESQNKKKQLYGRKKLLKLVQSHFTGNQIQNAKLDLLIDFITADISHFIDGGRQMDDVTLLAVKRR